MGIKNKIKEGTACVRASCSNPPSRLLWWSCVEFLVFIFLCWISLYTLRIKRVWSFEEPRDDVIPSFSHKNVKPFSLSAFTTWNRILNEFCIHDIWFFDAKRIFCIWHMVLDVWNKYFKDKLKEIFSSLFMNSFSKFAIYDTESFRFK